MHWNHRVVEYTGPDGVDYVAMREVFYNEDDKPYSSCEPFLNADNVAALRENIQRMLEALDKPPIKETDFDKDRMEYLP